MYREFEIRDLPAQPAMSVRATVPQSEIGSIMGQLLPRVYGYVMATGEQPESMPYARYYSMGPEVDLECGVTVADPLPDADDIKASELPGGLTAVATHFGSYETLHETYGALTAWMSESGYQPAGAPWEVYLTDPQAEPDSAKWRTDLFFPAQKAG